MAGKQKRSLCIFLDIMKADFPPAQWRLLPELEQTESEEHTKQKCMNVYKVVLGAWQNTAMLVI